MTTVHPRRGGFSLVELLVVISLLAVLAAIGTAAFFKVRVQQESSATESTLTKLNLALDGRWKAILDAAAEDARSNRVPPTVVQFCGNDKDRIRTVWTYLKLKNEFPTTLAEAQTDIKMNDVVVLGHRTVFDAPNNLPPAANAQAGTELIQSAACFYLAVTATGNRGQTFGSDGTGQQTADVDLPTTAGTVKARVFVDAWGGPIAFVRMAYGGEVQGPPYLAPNAGSLTDPLDKVSPAGKLTATWTNLTTFWAGTTASPVTTGVVANYPTAFSQVPSATAYTKQNWVPTLVSAGVNRQFGGTVGTDDDVVSYRLRREGNRGD